MSAPIPWVLSQRLSLGFVDASNTGSFRRGESGQRSLPRADPQSRRLPTFLLLIVIATKIDVVAFFAVDFILVVVLQNVAQCVERAN